jgi:uncharacterized membrane protein YraQ (UPF0718 family)
MDRFLADTLSAFWQIMLDSGVWLLAGLALAGIVHAFIPAGFLAKHLASAQGGSKFTPILKASLLGIPLPLCSCSVIPVAAGLRSSGAGKGASAAFAISTPQTGEESVPLTWALFGPVFALARPVIAVATALTAGLLIEKFTDERTDASDEKRDGSKAKPCCASAQLDPIPEPEPETGSAPESAGACCSLNILGTPTPPSSPEPDPSLPAAKPGSCCCSTPEPEPEPAKSCCSGGEATPTSPTITARTKTALRHGFVTMLLDLAPWLAVGLVLSAIIAALVPEGWIAEHVGTGLVPMLLMLVVGLPLYVCATSSTPLAFSLVAAGLSPGAALVLLLAGPATNAATMSWALKDLGVRALAIYLAVIAAFAVGAGLLFDATLSGFVHLASGAHGHDHTAVSVLQSTGAAVFLAMLAVALLVRAKRAMAGREQRHDAAVETDSALDSQHDHVAPADA